MVLREAVGTGSALGDIGLDAARGPNVARYNRHRTGLDRQTFQRSQLLSRRIHSTHPSRSFRSPSSTRGTLWQDAGPVLQIYRRPPSRPGRIVKRRTRKGQKKTRTLTRPKISITDPNATFKEAISMLYFAAVRASMSAFNAAVVVE